MTEFIPSDEVLMAYADGELDTPVAQALEAAMITDAALVSRLLVFLRSRRLVRAAFAAEGLEPVSEDLTRAARAGRPASGAMNMQRTAKGEAPRWREWLQGFAWAPLGALAGALAILAVLQPWRADGTGPFATLDSGEASALMYRLSSGDSAQLGNGQVRVMSTVQIKGGGVCREVDYESAGDRAEAVTCASPERPWTIHLASRSTNAPEAFTPSAGSDPADAFFKRNEGGARLTGEDEQRVLAHLRESHGAGI